MTSSPMIRSGNSGGILRILRSYKSYLFAVLFLYLLVILVFHSQLHVYDGSGGGGGITVLSRSLEASPSILRTSSSHLHTPTSHKTPVARNTTKRFSGPKTVEDEPRSKDSDLAFPLLTDCFPTSSINSRPRKTGLSFQSIGEHYLYSAYFDDRISEEPATIRIIALLKKSDDFRFFCHVPFSTGEDLTDPGHASDGQGSTKDQGRDNQASVGGTGSHGTGGYSDIQGMRGIPLDDEHYLKLKYYAKSIDNDSKNKSESYRDNKNASRLMLRMSNSRIDSKSASYSPPTGDNPESRYDPQGTKDDSHTEHRRLFESHPGISYHTVRASVYEMCENHNKGFGGWILSCPLGSHIRRPPCEVLVSIGRHRTQPNASASASDDSSSVVVSIPVFRLRNQDEEDQQKREDFGICVPPLFGHIPSTTLVEFVEFSRILGANHFVFYHHHVSREIAKTLIYYAARGMVTTIRWDLPVDDKTVWYHGQLLAINDCLYRSMHAFRHVAFNDIDEFVVPHVHRTWREMTSSFRSSSSTLGRERTTFGAVELLERRSSPSDGLPRNLLASEQWQVSQPSKGTHHGPQSVGKSSQQPFERGSTRGPLPQGHGDTADYAGYSFQSAFFDPLLSGLISHVMYDLESDLRTKTFSRVRSKVMVRPEAIFELGIHHVSRLVSEDLEVYHVPTEVAFVHHYRKCISEFDPLMSCQIFAHDESLSRYIPTIRHNIHQTLWCMKEEAAQTDDAHTLHWNTDSIG